MGYVGNQAVQGYSSIPAKQDLTGATGGTLTLTHAVASSEAIDLYINNVRQEPTTSYSAAGTTVTLNGYTVAATDDIYVVYNALALQTSVPPDDTVTTAKIQNNAVTMDKLATSGTLPALDGSALTGLSAAGSEYFLVRLDADSAVIASGTDTVVDFGGNGTVIHDTASNVDTTNDAYEFNSSNGVYLINYAVGIRSALLTTEQVIDGYAFLEFSSDTFSTIDRPFAHVINARDGAGDELGGFVLTKTQLYKVTASGTKVRLVAGCAINSAGWQIEASLQGMTQGTVPNDSFVTSMSIVRIA